MSKTFKGPNRQFLKSLAKHNRRKREKSREMKSCISPSFVGEDFNHGPKRIDLHRVRKEILFS